MNMGQYRGFTLMELMIVMAIVGILAALALPSFMDSTRKARRADAMDALTAMHLNQEKWRANNTTYTGTLSDVWGGGDYSADGHYKLSLASASGTGYTSTATAQGGQTSDPCGNFILEVDSGIVEKYTSVYTDYTSIDAKRCWRR